MEKALIGAKLLSCLLSLSFFMVLANPASARQLQLIGPQKTIKEGYFTVTVEASANSNLQGLLIEAAQDPSFNRQVQTFPALGDFKQLSLTGFGNGTYFLRAISKSAEQPSNVIKVTVSHYPLWQALGLFSTGLLIFIVLIFIIIRAHRQEQYRLAAGRQEHQ